MTEQSGTHPIVVNIIERLERMFDIKVADLDGIEEPVTFRLPRALLNTARRPT